jgi:alpha-D-xyloside xylohydrolase
MQSVILVVLFLTTAFAQMEPGRWERLDDGVLVRAGGTNVRLRVFSDRIVHVVSWPEAAPTPSRPSLAVEAAAPAGPSFDVREEAGLVIVRTARLVARVSLGTGAVAFEDETGRSLLREEADGGKTFTPVEAFGERTLQAQQEFETAEGESLYGLGQHQDRLLDIAGHDLELWQHNREVVIPFLVSSKGWGLLWDNPAHMRFGRPQDVLPIPAEAFADDAGQPGRLTAAFFADRDLRQPLPAPRGVAPGSAPGSGPDATALGVPPAPSVVDLPPAIAPKCLSVRWTGTLVVPRPGEYALFNADNLGDFRLWLDDRPLIDYWSPWLLATDVARVRLEAGRRYRLRLEWRREDAKSTLTLKWLPPRERRPLTSLWSASAEAIDYWFVRGSSLDETIAGYRELTGRAALLPRWALGYWQSRERYKTGDELEGMVRQFRERRFPLDVIVQDWQYWREGQWGSHAFDPARYPDPKGTMDRIHALGAKVLISVWAKFYPGTANFEELRRGGFLYPYNLDTETKDHLGRVYTYYDAFNPEARKVYWRQIDRDLFSKGIDAWWLDATEPEMLAQQWPGDIAMRMTPTALGPGARVLNAFPTMTCRAVFEGQRASAPAKRVSILTRSAWAGSQRYGATVWSGDITARWGVLRAQIPAGLSYSLSGMPWWATDIGAFNTDHPGGNKSEAYRELFARWFQFGAFCPIFRTHGSNTEREPWFFGAPDHPAWRSLLTFAELRYRLLPYNYTLAARVTREQDTIMRALAMDFPDDPRARDVQDQYLFGPAFLVNPVTEPGARTRPVYLPPGGWYDFWTGAAVEGSRTIEAAAPYEAMPLYVRAGSIVPFGPSLQWTGEKPADPLRVVVYTGREGSFTLYEDDGETNGHEKGAFSTIAMAWSESSRTLTIGDRQGSFPGMLGERTIEVAFASASRPVAYDLSANPDRVVRYSGARLVVPAP